MPLSKPADYVSDPIIAINICLIPNQQIINAVCDLSSRLCQKKALQRIRRQYSLVPLDYGLLQSFIEDNAYRAKLSTIVSKAPTQQLGFSVPSRTTLPFPDVKTLPKLMEFLGTGMLPSAPPFTGYPHMTLAQLFIRESKIPLLISEVHHITSQFLKARKAPQPHSPLSHVRSRPYHLGCSGTAAGQVSALHVSIERSRNNRQAVGEAAVASGSVSRSTIRQRSVSREIAERGVDPSGEVLVLSRLIRLGEPLCVVKIEEDLPAQRQQQARKGAIPRIAEESYHVPAVVLEGNTGVDRNCIEEQNRRASELAGFRGSASVQQNGSSNKDQNGATGIGEGERSVGEEVLRDVVEALVDRLRVSPMVSELQNFLECLGAQLNKTLRPSSLSSLASISPRKYDVMKDDRGLDTTVFFEATACNAFLPTYRPSPVSIRYAAEYLHSVTRESYEPHISVGSTLLTGNKVSEMYEGPTTMSLGDANDTGSVIAITRMGEMCSVGQIIAVWGMNTVLDEPHII